MDFPLRGRLLLEALWDCLHFDGRRRVEKAETASLASIIEAHATPSARPSWTRHPTWSSVSNGSTPARLTRNIRGSYRRFFRPPRGTRRAAVLRAVRDAAGRRDARAVPEPRRRAAAVPCRDAPARDALARTPGSPGSVNTVGSYQDHSRVVRQRRYTVPPGRRGASCVVPHDLQTYSQAGIRVPP